MAKDTTYFISAIRQLSNTENDPIVTDPEVLDRASEGLAALYDLIIATYEHHSVSFFNFTLTGGVGKNSVALPEDFYKDVFLDKDPSTRPITVHRFSSTVDRNNLPKREYTLLGSNLIVSPPEMAAGNYRLAYTPLIQPFLPVSVATTAYPTVTLNSTGGAADGTLHNWFFPTAAFDSTYIGRFIYVTGASNSVNNGFHTITSVPDATDIRTSGTVASESFGPGVTAVVYTGPLDNVTTPALFANIWTFAHADFVSAGLQAGDTFIVAGTGANDGTYTVAAIIDAHTVNSVEVAPTAEMSFPAGVTVTYQTHGTISVLPQIFQPWYEFIQVHAAIAIKDKIEQDTSDLEIRLARLTDRVQKMAANRMSEGGQIGLPRSDAFWFEDEFPLAR